MKIYFNEDNNNDHDFNDKTLIEKRFNWYNERFYINFYKIEFSDIFV